METGGSVGTLAQDIRHGLCMLFKTPGFTVVAIITLAFGIDANTAIFSVVQGVILAPLPYREPDRLFMVLESNLRFPLDAISYLRIFRKVIRQEFQGDVTAKFNVLGLINNSHAAATEFFYDAVMRDGLPGKWLRLRHAAVILGC